MKSRINVPTQLKQQGTAKRSYLLIEQISHSRIARFMSRKQHQLEHRRGGEKATRHATTGSNSSK